MIKQTDFKYCGLLDNKYLDLYPTQFGWHKCSESSKYISAIKSSYIIHVVLNGRGYYCVNDKKYLLQKNDIFLIKPGEHITYYPDPNDVWEYIWFGFNGKDVESFLNEYINQYVFHLKATDRLQMIIENLFEKEDDIDKLLINGSLYIFLSEINQAITKKHYITNNNSIINNIIKYISKNYINITVTLICDKFAMDRTNLFKIFKKEYGKSPQQYIIDYKLEIARSLLIETDISLKDVAINSGYSDYVHFSKMFSNHFGLSPSNYRKKSIKNSN